MDITENSIQLPDSLSSLKSFFLLLGLSLIGFYGLGPFLGLIAALPFYDGSLVEFQNNMINAMGNESMKVPLFIVQGMATLTGTILVPWAFVSLGQKESLSFVRFRKTGLLPLVLTALIVFSFMGVNSLIIEWNANFEFPSFMSGFEKWARETEDLAAQMTEYLTSFESIGMFILAFVVVAIFPAVGEELLFRGLIQNQMHRITRNPHIAIWIAAFLFSAIHMQFFGFVPRMLLGALFGYLYFWSGNLLIPIVAHLVNNGFTLTMFYLHNTGVIDIDLANAESSPLYAVGIFAIITFLLLFYFKKYFNQARNTP